jgi:HTH-type transcriptional regulator, global nitrogen regulator NrpRI
MRVKEGKINMDAPSRKKIISILNILHDTGKHLGSTKIAQKLQDTGVELSQRTVRHYLSKTDKDGLTQGFGKKGRIITPKGEEELKSSFVINKVGFVASKIDNLTYQMDFSLRKQSGKIILNISTIDQRDLKKAIPQLQQVFRAGLGMGRYTAIINPGEKFGKTMIQNGKVGIGTVCSVTINGIFLHEGIHITSRFGGLLELNKGRPVRFTEIINYDGSSIDPLEVFIKGGMTSVNQAVLTGNGRIGASFREVPSVAIPFVDKLRKKMDKIGLGGILLVGRPGQPLLDIPVAEGRAGMVVAGGLNPLAAIEESGVATQNIAMGSLYEFQQMVPFWELKL